MIDGAEPWPGRIGDEFELDDGVGDAPDPSELAEVIGSLFSAHVQRTLQQLPEQTANGEPWFELPPASDVVEELMGTCLLHSWPDDPPPDWRREPGVWLVGAWCGLAGRDRTILVRRAAGETLEAIASDLGITRERVRQIQSQKTRELVAVVSRGFPGLDAAVSAGTEMIAVTGAPGVAGASWDQFLEIPASTPRDVLIAGLEFRHPDAWSTTIPHWWTRRPDQFDAAMAQLVASAPFSHAETDSIVDALRLPSDYATVLDAPGSRLTRHELGWVRRGRVSRDAAYLWLRAEGEPRSAAVIADAVGVNTHAIAETLRRDEAFVQVRPEGTWGLVDWRLPDVATRYASALDVVVEVLTQRGPMSFQSLRDEVQRLYPVTEWRVRQCLISNLVGVTPTGLYDLAERGAAPVPESEPRQPANIQVAGNLTGVRLTVSTDLLRGSGLPVNRWLTWHLGLRHAPSSRAFRLPGDHGEVIVRRATSNGQISTLRGPAQTLGVALGCSVTLLLQADTATADLLHTCTPEHCPADGPTRARLSG
ncbi:MAG: hypothetical protein NVV70_03715 [Cellulomonas sp.]|nr:sigma factor-like helix-turn-helix DNA-binding protein [Cellulomonas sp.]MCR6647275.1 hypothetical protein [Cellulomonas sp.]